MNANTDEGLTQPAARGPWGPWATVGLCAVALAVLLLLQVLLTVAAIAFTVATDPQADVLVVARELPSNGVFFGLSGITTVPAACGVVLLFARLRKGYPLREYLGLKKVTGRQLAVWMGAAVILMACSDALTLLLGRPIVPPVVQEPFRTPGALPVLAAAILLAAPICEEIIFRGFLFEGLRASRLRPLGAVVVVTLAWTALHAQYDAYGLATIFVIGILLGIARHRTGSVVPCIAMHFANNLVAMLEALWSIHL